MTRLQESQLVVRWTKGWSVIVAILTFACAFALAVTLEYIKEYEWTVNASASVVLIIGSLSGVAGFVLMRRNKNIARTFAEEYMDKHGVALSLSVRAKDIASSVCDNDTAVFAGIVWCIGCLWSLYSLGVYKNDISENDWWFAVTAHLVNFAVAMAFTVLYLYIADYMRIIDRGTTPATASLVSTPGSPPAGMVLRSLAQEPRRAAQPERVPRLV